MHPSSAVDLRRLARRLSIGSLWVLAAWASYQQVEGILRNHAVAEDSHAYWLTGHVSGNLYGLPAGARDAYLYSPVFALVVRPLTLLPFHAFAAVWLLAECAALTWLLWGSRLRWTVPLILFAGVPELFLGNIYPFLAVALVLAFRPDAQVRGSAAMAIPLLTKITPGLPLVYFGLRRDWRRLALSLSVTAFLVAATLLVVPRWWSEWFGFLLHGNSQTFLFYPLRLVLAAALVVLAARTGRAEFVPFVALLALPVIAGCSVLTILTGVPRIASAVSPQHAAGLDSSVGPGRTGKTLRVKPGPAVS